MDSPIQSGFGHCGQPFITPEVGSAVIKWLTMVCRSIAGPAEQVRKQQKWGGVKWGGVGQEWEQGGCRKG